MACSDSSFSISTISETRFPTIESDRSCGSGAKLSSDLRPFSSIRNSRNESSGKSEPGSSCRMRLRSRISSRKCERFCSPSTR
eukprot:1791283-Pleurochrysis_carterae.AAC.1